MSSFAVGLAVLGALVLAAVLAHGLWQVRRAQPRQAQPDAADGMGHAADGPRVEPMLADLPPPALVPAERRHRLDPLIDAIATVWLDHPVSGDAALAAMPPTRRVGSKPFAVEGQNQATEQWETPVPGQRYTAFQAGVQLANRAGPLNDIEFSEFVVKVQAFADAVGGTAELPDMRHEVARGRELDQFAQEHDAQLGFTLRARKAAWSPGYIQQHAARRGFVAGVIPGRMVLPGQGPGTPPVLVLAFDTQAALADEPAQAAVRSVTLTLEVPHVARDEQPFVRLRDVAIALAASMEGAITDDQGRVIAADALDTIGADLERLYDALEARDLAAGSPQARRLFS